MGWYLSAGLLVLGLSLVVGAFILGKKREAAGLREKDRFFEDSGDVEKYKLDLADRDYKVRAISVERLGNVGGPGVPELLFNAMADKNEEVKLAAAAALKRLKDPEVAYSLVGALREPNKWLPARVAEVLVSLGQAAVPVLHEALHDEDPAVRGYVIEILGEIGDKSSADALHLALQDKNANIRLQAAAALGSLAHPDSAVFLADILGDPELKVRIQVIRSLGKIGGPLAGRHLSALLESEDDIMIHMVLDAFRHMGPNGLNLLRDVASALSHPASVRARAVLKEEGILDSAKVNIKYGTE